MGTLEENFETAVDESSESEARERAIDTLETANACSKLADIVRRDGLDDRYREQALRSLAHPQCKTMLETLAEEGELEESLREQAESLLEETPDSAGAGP
jgi:thymidine phosphorylase